MKLFIVTLLLLLSYVPFSYSQEDASSQSLNFTLEDVIRIAREQSPDALVAKNQLINKYWQYRTFRADFMPNLVLDATLPDLDRSISSITLPDGTDSFVHRSLATSSAGLSLKQNIGLTGAQVFVNTQLQRLDIFDGSNTFSFLSRPIAIGIIQPIFSFNGRRWQKKIEPLRYEEAKRQYNEAMEEIAVKSVDRFFGLFLAQINLSIALKNQANNDTLYKISQGRYNLGKIAENELLQMELNLLNSNIAVAQSQLDVQISQFNLKTFLGYKENVKIELVAPADVPDLQIDYAIALEHARKQRKKVVELERELLEARREVARAKGESGLNANINASFGLTQSGFKFTDAYITPIDQQQVRIGVEIPIVDWGKSKAQVRTAMANYELVKTTVEQDALSFEQEIFLNVMQFNMQRGQLLIAAKADTISSKRYEVAKQRYLIGKIDITDLSIALNDKDVSRRAYVEAMKNYWITNYGIRRLTLYDFRDNKPINYSVEGTK